MKTTCILGLLASIILTGCGTVEITKTGRGFHNPTNPNMVEILMTVPKRNYQELGVFQASGFMRTETAVMHNAIRTKAAELGADAALITDTGLAPTRSNGTPMLFANGVALKFQ
jgi:hypothetical protein